MSVPLLHARSRRREGARRASAAPAVPCQRGTEPGTRPGWQLRPRGGHDACQRGGIAGGEGGGRQVLVRRSSLIFYSSGAERRREPLRPLVPKPQHHRTRHPVLGPGAGTAHPGQGGRAEHGATCFTDEAGLGLPPANWALRGSRLAPACCRLGALRESRGSPDLPKVAGTSIQRAPACRNHPGCCRCRAGGGAGYRDGGSGSPHPGEPLSTATSVARSSRGAETQPLSVLRCLIPLCPFPGGGLLSPLGSAYLGPLNPASLVIWLGEERYLEREEGLHMFICMLGGFSSPPACRCPALQTAEPKYCAPHQSPRNPADKYLRGGWWSKRCPGKRLLLHLEGPRSRLARPAWHGRQARSGQEPWHGLPSRLVPSASRRSQRRGW